MINEPHAKFDALISSVTVILLSHLTICHNYVKPAFFHEKDDDCSISSSSHHSQSKEKAKAKKHWTWILHYEDHDKIYC